ncbi:MAG: hypothetical protein J6T16_06720 [Opitutales bacterium]|nr:hypothetical protein [Opitutales bacterium]
MTSPKKIPLGEIENLRLGEPFSVFGNVQGREFFVNGIGKGMLNFCDSNFGGLGWERSENPKKAEFVKGLFERINASCAGSSCREAQGSSLSAAQAGAAADFPPQNAANSPETQKEFGSSAP